MKALAEETVAVGARDRSRRALEIACQRLEEASAEHFGVVATVELRLVGHHAYSTTGLLSVRTPSGDRNLVAKTLQGSSGLDQQNLIQVQREYDALARCRAIFGTGGSLRVPAPIAIYPDLQCVVMEAVSGPTLAAVLAEARRWARPRRIEGAVAVCRLGGQWLRCLRDATSSTVPVGNLDILAQLEGELGYLAAHSVPPVTEPFIGSVREYVRRLLRRIEAEPVAAVSVHGGFAPYNVIVSPDRRAISLIDFAAFRTGPMHYDYFKFMSKLEVLGFGPSFSGDVIRRLGDAFGEGYGLRVDRGAPINQVLRIGFALDRMTAFAENAARHSPLNRFLLRRLFRVHHRWLKELCES